MDGFLKYSHKYVNYTYIETPLMLPFVVSTDSYILEEETTISTLAWIQNWQA